LEIYDVRMQFYDQTVLFSNLNWYGGRTFIDVMDSFALLQIDGCALRHEGVTITVLIILKLIFQINFKKKLKIKKQLRYVVERSMF
jgi:hypothetical protein